MLFNDWNNPTSAERNELVFVDRNLSYGAYQLRTRYNKRIFLAFVFTTAVFLMIILGLWLPSLLSGSEDEGLGQITIDQQEINMEQKKEDPLPPPPEPPVPAVPVK